MVRQRRPGWGWTVDLEGSPFVALDFETADNGRDSACAVGLVRVEGEEITGRLTRLIRPPRRTFLFTHVHGIVWADVADAPGFADVWRDAEPLLVGARFLVSHFAPFDRGVLQACCAAFGLAPPAMPHVCTVQWARRAFGARPATLPAVCGLLGISLRHHDPGSDAEACARIMIAVQQAMRAAAAADARA